MKKRYHILDSAKQQPVIPNDLTRLLSQNSQLMLPLVELVEQCRGAVDEVIDVTGRAAIQAVLELSAQQVTGGKLSQPGKKAPRRCGPLGPPARSRQAQQPQTARQQTQTAQTLRRRGQSARLRSDAGRRTPRRAHARHSDEGRLDAQLCRGDWRNGRHGRGVEIRRQPGRQSRPPKRASTKCSRGAWMSWICW